MYDDSGCTNEVGSETVDVTGTGATTADGIEVFSPGAYYWRVSYTGDQYNNGFTTGCGEEVTWIFALDSFHENVPARAVT